MRLNKPRVELTRLGALPEGGCCDLQSSKAGQPSFGYLTKLTHMMEQNPAAHDASVHSEMRRAQTESQRARERALVATQLARQLAR